MADGAGPGSDTARDPGLRLAAELRALRIQSGMTLRELEPLTHASDSALSRYLNGSTVPPWPVIESLCRVTEDDPRRLRPIWIAADRGRKRSMSQQGRNFLPRTPSSFVGRTPEMQALMNANGVVAVDGMAGVGKTALAIRTGYALEKSYPDGQLYIDLHGHTKGRGALEPGEALHMLLSTLGMPSGEIPDDVAARSALWRAELARRCLVVVLDNALSSEQVQPLLPGAPGSIVIVTSRHRLSRLSCCPSISLDVLSPAEAAEMFTRIAGEERVRQEGSAEDSVMQIVRSCGYLPLGVRLAAGRLRHRPAWTVAYLASRLAQERDPLSELDLGDGGMAAAIALSMNDLEDDTLRMFRLLGAAPNLDIDTATASALADTSMTDAHRMMEALLDVHLVEQTTIGQYQLHCLAREYARRLLAELPAAERGAAWLRAREHQIRNRVIRSASAPGENAQ